ncbi:alpha-hydroxy acid oxidase [Burkholderia sp. MS455]|uniref:alpha-hydroxy acid oxidase n=1 Tax=Burkholderia sp. MS455 TaxID=2811788 RepID=UPI001EF5FF13|nr:alpha-hydroxy acid oxidase [Burkholderia sp. MS455]
MLFDYLDGGANGESTLSRNCADYDRWVLRGRVLGGVSAVDLATTFFGDTHRLPLMLGPIGFAGMMARRGELVAAKVAGECGIAQCLSTFSVCSVEDVAAVRKGPLYFQLYMLRNRALTENLLDRARAAGIKTLIWTVDTPVTPRRERDERNGFRARRVPSVRLLVDVLRHPAWLGWLMADGIPRLGTISRYPELGRWVMDQSVGLGQQIDPDSTWEAMRWLRVAWSGRLVVKGIMSADDARRALDCGADGLMVSNHGGRQLDPAASTIRVLPEIARAVGSDADVVLDGGIRRGADVIKAIALGASGVALGRAYVYGLAACGAVGVAGVIELFRSEIEASLILMGVKSIAELRGLGEQVLESARS